MRIVAFADLHLTNSNPKFKTTNGVSDLLSAQSAYLQHVKKVAEERDADAIVFLGDYTDDETLDPVVQTFANHGVDVLTDFDGSVILIEGNHCVSDSKNEYTVLGAADRLCRKDNVEFVLLNDSIRVGDTVFHCFPYMSDYRLLEQLISETNDGVNTDLVNVMLFHFPTKNAMLDNGLKSSGGVELSDEIISNFDLCLGGDFHKPQQVTDDCYYVGAPFDFKFGEHLRRHTTVVDIDKDGYSIEKVENPFQYDILKVDVEEFLERDWQRADKTIVKVVGKPTAEQISKVDEKKKEFYRLMTCFDEKEGDGEEELSVDIVEENGAKDLDLIRSQMIKRGVDEDVLDRAVEIYETELV